jgi:hypothetical protein
VKRKSHPLLAAKNRAWSRLRSYEHEHGIRAEIGNFDYRPADEEHARLLAAMREARQAYENAGEPRYA